MNTCIKCGKQAEWTSKSGYCEECAEEILSKAKTKTPIYKRWWVWAIAALLLIGIITPKNGRQEGAYASNPTPTSVAKQVTATAAPTPTPEPTPTPVPFEPIVLTGEGDDVVEADLPSNGIFVVDIDYQGDHNFSVWSHADGNDELLVNEIGNYSGSHVLWGDNTVFEVTASDSWSMEIDEIKLLPTINASGHGDMCPGLYYATANDSGVYLIEHTGNSNFSIWMYTTYQTDLLVNEIGNYSGKKLIEVSDGELVLFQVTADGDWQIRRAD